MNDTMDIATDIVMDITFGHTVDGRLNQTLAVLLSPLHPPISMLPWACGGQQNQTLNAEEIT